MPTETTSPNEIELWVRGAGKVVGDEAPRQRTQRMNLDEFRLVTMRFDIQYGQAYTYRGIALWDLCSRFAPEATLDLAILHFANGMAVPLPFRDAVAMRRLVPFVARGMAAGPGEPMRVGVFPPIPKKDARADARPITFSGNKIIVADKWHPAIGDKVQTTFSPWMHVDTLVGIEFVQAEPYYRQFNVDTNPDVQRGFGLFQQSCQFCHGARKTGAKFGWDFVEPFPIYTYRKQMNLFYHVAYKPIDAAERGLMMPAMRFMSESDAGALWQWLRAVATKPMPPYALAPAPTPTPAPTPAPAP